MKKPCSTDSIIPRGEPVTKAPEINVPEEFKLFMHLMAGNFCSSEAIALALVQLKNILTKKHGAAYANAYVYELAEAFSRNRSTSLQGFCG
jgi:hypothetical protein